MCFTSCSTSFGHSIYTAYLIFKNFIRNHSSSNYTFIFNERPSHEGVAIYFINNPIFQSTVRENIDVFKKELGDSITAEGLLNAIESQEKPLMELIHFHEGILGILLGYGRHNALLFQKKSDILGRCWGYGKLPPPAFFYLPHHSGDFASFEAELEYLDNKLDGFSNYSDYDYFLSIIPPLGFCADKSNEETIILEKKYAKTRAHISKMYTQQFFVKAILDQLFKQ